jgi:hypothetical protein
MSDIKPGDVVMLVWGCCARARRDIGWTGVVEGIRATESARCEKCGISSPRGPHVVWSRERDYVVPFSWLIKMPGESVNAEKRQECET